MTPTSCPVCRQPGGFHDTDELFGRQAHRAARDRIPPQLRRPSNTALRREARA